MALNGKNEQKYTFNSREVSCTACHHEVKVLKQGSLYSHPVLNVLICKKCYKFYTSGAIEKDEDGVDVQCRWCGDGGEVICCTSCTSVFCMDCIEVNFGVEELFKVQSQEEWQCYVCDPRPLSKLLSTFKKLQHAINHKHHITITPDPDDDEGGGGIVNDGGGEVGLKDDGVDIEVGVNDVVKNDEEEDDDIESNNDDDDDDDYKENSKTQTPKTPKNTIIDLSKTKLNATSLTQLTDDVGKIMVASKLLHNNLTASLGTLLQTSHHQADLQGKLNQVAKSINHKFHRLVSRFAECSAAPIKITISKKRLRNNSDKHTSSQDTSEVSKDGDKKEVEKKIDKEGRVLGKIKEKLRMKKLEKKKIKNNDDDEEDDGKNKNNDEVENDNKMDINEDDADGKVIDKDDSAVNNDGDDDNDVGHEGEDDDDDDDKKDKKNHHHHHHKHNKKAEKKARVINKRGKKKDGDEEDEDDLLKKSDKFFDNLMKVDDGRKKVKKEEEKEDEDNDACGDDDSGGGGIKKDIKTKKKLNKKHDSNDDDEVDDEDNYDDGDNVKIEQKNLSKTNKTTKKRNDDDDDDDDDENLTKKIRIKLNKKNKIDDDGEIKKEKLKSKINKKRNKIDDDDDDDEEDADDDDKNVRKHGHVRALNFDKVIEDVDLQDNKLMTTSKKRNEEDDEEDDDTGDLFDSLKDMNEDFVVEKEEKMDGVKGGEGVEDEDVEEVADEFMEKKEKKTEKHHRNHHHKKHDKSKLKNNDDDDDFEKVDEEEEEEEERVEKRKRKKDKLLSTKLFSSDEEGSDDDDDFVKKIQKSDNDEDDEEEEKVGKKGRKGNKRRKTKDEDDYDDDELKEIMKEEEEERRMKRKKRRRIKRGDSSEDEDGDDSDKEGDEDDSGEDFQKGSGKKRKRIHRIYGSKKLSKETIDAAKAEEERRKRIDERQKLFNQVTIEDTDSPTKCPITTKLVLEADPETKEPIVEVHKKVISKLKPHQVDAVKFMWSCCVESLERLHKEEGSGCLLAHCMGLGKTLSVIAFVHTLLRHTKVTKMTTALVLTPLNTVLNWESEFHQWLQNAKPLDVYEMSSVKDNWSRAEIIKTWSEEGGVLIMGYDMFRTLSQLTRIKNKKQKTSITEGLLDPGPDLVICDEGHILKNDNTGLSKACNKIKTKRRIVLTGTPLQNNLVEYHCMVTFVKPNLLGTRKEFLNRFVNPITNGQCSDSTPRDVRVMKNRAHVLHETLSGCVQRRDYSSLTKYLLPKHEYVISIRLSDKQRALYESYLSRASSGEFSINRGSRMFADYQNLMKIWTHPWVLKMDEIKQEYRRHQKDDLDSFLDDSMEEDVSWVGSDESESIKSVSLDDDEEDDEDDKKKKKRTKSKKKKKKKVESSDDEKKAEDDDEEKGEEDGDKKEEDEVVKDWKSRSRRSDAPSKPEVNSKKTLNKNVESEEEEEDKGKAVSEEWWGGHVGRKDEYDTLLSGKLVLLAEILKLSESIGDKVLLFSQSLLSLDLVERFLSHWEKNISKDPDNQQWAGRQGWDKGIDYIRMDGSTSAQNRKDWAQMFNNEDNQKVRLFLISTKAGSLGINLVAANRVIIFDASWNPSHDIQSIFRVYRFGQTKPVYVYRFLAQGTMEEKIYERQVLKQSLAQRVVDEHQVERHFTSADLNELYAFKPNIYDPDDDITPKLPKDRLLAELLKKQKKWIVQYHEHDSLLENRPEEELTEEERKAAWEEFEQDKLGIRVNNYPNANAGGMQGYMYNQAYNQPYLPDLSKIIQAMYQQNPTLTQEELSEKAQLYMNQQLMQQHQRNYMLQQQQKERERLMKLHEESLQRQRMEALKKIGTILIDDDK